MSWHVAHKMLLTFAYAKTQSDFIALTILVSYWKKLHWDICLVYIICLFYLLKIVRGILDNDEPGPYEEPWPY